MRAWFAANDFVEVETGALQVSPGNEAHLHAFATKLMAPDGASSRLYLRTSPEFACKKLLAAGERRIVEFAKVFRNRERGALHPPEFTLVEWYRAGEPYQTLMGDCAAIWRRRRRQPVRGSFLSRPRGRSVCRAGAADAWPMRSRASPASISWRRLTGGEPDRECLARAALAAGIRIADDDSWGDIFSRVLVERVEPNSASGVRPCWTNIRPGRRRWRGPQAIRASPSASSFMSAAWKSPTGSASLLTRPNSAGGSKREMAEKQRRYGERYPLDEDFMAALSQMPDACGIALGLDRLVMLATGASRIDQVCGRRCRATEPSYLLTITLRMVVVPS